MKSFAQIFCVLAAAPFAATADLGVAVNPEPKRLSGWFDVALSSAAVGPLASDTGVVDGTGAWDAEGIAGGAAEVLSSGDGKFLAVRDYGCFSGAAFVPRATPDASFRTEDFTVRFQSFADGDPSVASGTKGGITLVKRGEADPTFAVYDNGGWTDVFLGDGSSVPATNVWYEGRVQFRRDSDGLNAAYLIKTSSGYEALHDAGGAEWFLSGTGSAVSNVVFSGTGDVRAVGGRRLAGLFVTVP